LLAEKAVVVGAVLVLRVDVARQTALVDHVPAGRDQEHRVGGVEDVAGEGVRETHVAQETQRLFAGRGGLADDAGLVGLLGSLLGHRGVPLENTVLPLADLFHHLFPSDLCRLLSVYFGSLFTHCLYLPGEAVEEDLHDDLGVVRVDGREKGVGVEFQEDLFEQGDPGFEEDDDDGLEQKIEGDAQRGGLIEVDVRASDEPHEETGVLD
jgi:hypothetical protein